MVGENIGAIRGSYFTGSVSGEIVGGLVGTNLQLIRDSYASGSVTGAANAGGLTGDSVGNILNSYATSLVTGAANAGGLVGENGGTISNSYSIGPVIGSGNIGGLLGNNLAGSVGESYWNIETSGQLASAGGIGQTTLQLVTQTSATGSIYEFWTAESAVLSGGLLWDFGDNRQYPGLRLPLSTDDCTVDADTLLCTHRPAFPDAPAASITAADPTTITEGEVATFRVTLGRAAPVDGLTISVAVTESGSYIAGSAPATVVIAEGATTGTLTVSTEDDSLDEADGAITVRINTGAGYTVGTLSTALVTVLDDDVAPPVARIDRAQSLITEGADATFTVTLSSVAPAGGLTISVTVTESRSHIDGSAPTEVVIAEGATTGTLVVSTEDDEMFEKDGNIVATINMGTGYTVPTASDLRRTSVGVLDNDILFARISAGLSPITEGADATFIVTLNRAVPAGGLTISVDVTESGSYIAGSAPTEVVIAVGATTVTLTVPTDDDAMIEEIGMITAELNMPADPFDSGYGVAVPPDHAATVTVLDNDAPAARISADPTTITEGEVATFTVALDRVAPAGGLTISVRVTESGSYIADLALRTVTIPIAVGTTTGTLTVSTEDDSLDESDGSITVRITTGAGYTVGTPSTATVTVNDNDIPSPDTPVASITSTRQEITEGEDATFTVTLDRAAPVGGLTISVTVTESRSHIDGSAPTEVFIAEGATTGTLTVPTDDDDVFESDGQITAYIDMGTGYTVALPPGHAGSLIVLDNDILLARISAGPSPITEGADATFIVTLNRAAPAGGLTISVDVTQSGSYIAGSAPETVVIAVGATTVTLTVPTDDDAMIEEIGMITAELNMPADPFDAGYSAARVPDNAAAVTVFDNDAPAARISAAAPTTITEGEVATFTVTLSSAAPADGLTISVDVTESGSYISGLAPETVVIAEGATTGTLTVSTEDDGMIEETGSITVRITTGAGYTVGTMSTAMVTVLDDDTPIARISAAGPTTITEGEVATFTVALDRTASAGGLTISVDVTESGSYIDETVPATVVIASGATTGTLTVSTEDDGLHESDGSITVRITTGAGYTVGTMSTAMVTVNDNDIPDPDAPVASITRDNDFITEGTAAIFKVTLSSAAPAGGLTISVTVTESDSYIDGAAPRTVTIPIAVGATTGTLTVPTEDDEVFESDGTITATITMGTGYTVALPPGHAAAVIVLDNDTLVARISAGPSPITEGADVTFTVTLNRAAPAGGLTISVDVTQSGSYIDGVAPRTVTIPIAVGVTTGTLTVSTEDDSLDESDGAITAELNVPADPFVAGYTVAAMRRTIRRKSPS